MITFDAYQNTAVGLATYPTVGENVLYPALGLAGEAGEAVDKIKKWWRNHGISNGKLYTDEQKKELAKELGDVLWYIAALGHEIGWSLNDIANLNVEKLQDRRERGVIKSEGDNR